MKPQALLWCFGLCAALLAGCAAQPGVRTGKETRIPGVVKVKETRIPGVRTVGETPAVVIAGNPAKEPEADAPTVVPAEEEPKVKLAAGDIEVEDLPIEAVPDPQVAMKEALDQALAWTIEGLIQYRSGSIEAAHKSLNAAHFKFQEVGLSEPFAGRGLNLFQESLPADLRLYDPEAIRLHLDQTDRPGGIELVEQALVDRGVRRLLWQLGDLPSRDRLLEELIIGTYQRIQYYQGKDRSFFEAAYRRKHKYWPRIQNALEKKELPPELGYVAFVESGFLPQAESPAKAYGLWQFIERTGKAFELKSFPDDFYDVEKSTRAAADYLFPTRQSVRLTTAGRRGLQLRRSARQELPARHRRPRKA